MTVVTKRFRVEERVEDQVPTIVWLRIFEGRKRGLDFAVEENDVTKQLSVGDVADITLKAENEKLTKWRVTDYEKRKL